MKYLIFILSVFLSFPGYAGNYDCPALLEDKTYKDQKDLRYTFEEADGWLFRTNDFKETLSFNDLAKNHYTELNQVLKSKNIDLVVVPIPPRAMTHEAMQNRNGYDRTKAIAAYYDLISKIRQTGIKVAEIGDFKGKTDFFYKRDHHWTAFGAKYMAEMTARQIKSLPIYASLPKKTFKTEKTGEEEQKRKIATFVEDVCGKEIPPEMAAVYSTYADGADDLLGDESVPDVLLVGTSHSVNDVSKGNFDGFLKEATGLDIENRAISGGGVDSALLSWLASPDYQVRQPKILIWEFPVHQNYSSPKLFHQLIPAIYGDCVDKPYLSADGTFDKRTVQIFSHISEKKINAENTHLVFKVPETKKRKFKAFFEFEDGSVKEFEFRRSKVDERHGTYFYRFTKEDMVVPVKNLKIEMQEDVTGSATVRVCRR
ncbi:MAG: hypothetical protein J0L77_04455 [Alphaproteobacteria bacterium]|nr:hypothetical protein [Alphaproteobacteria bacterium]